jgi:glycosyltransferase involved in cell wall biosynthesis
MLVEVLLSTYNGEKFLKEQLESLAIQDYTNFKITIRDDGSTDSTPKLIRDYMAQSPVPITLSVGKNIGVIRSYFELLKNSSDDAQFYAFCDQDDIWKSNKISKAIEYLEKIPYNVPAMYCSRTILVDESLKKELGYFPVIPKKKLGFSNALVENVAVGCTIVINKSARDYINSREINHSNIIMHDWWIYLCISAVGRVIFDCYPSVLYRQHNSNVIGGSLNTPKSISKKIMRFFHENFRKHYKKQAREFFHHFMDELKPTEKELLVNFIIDSSFVDRIKYALKGDIYRQTLLSNILLKWLIVLNRY